MSGGAGLIGGAMVQRLLAGTTATVFKLDKDNYTSDLTGTAELGAEWGAASPIVASVSGE